MNSSFIQIYVKIIHSFSLIQSQQKEIYIYIGDLCPLKREKTDLWFYFSQQQKPWFFTLQMKTYSNSLILPNKYLCLNKIKAAWLLFICKGSGMVSIFVMDINFKNFQSNSFINVAYALFVFIEH